MDRNNYFEQLLANETEGYRMHPSEKVWNNIQKNIGSKFKPTAIALSALFAMLFLLMYNKPNTTTPQSNFETIHITNINTNNNKDLTATSLNATGFNKKLNLQKSKTNINTKKATALTSSLTSSKINIVTTKNLFLTNKNEEIAINQNLVAANDIANKVVTNNAKTTITTINESTLQETIATDENKNVLPIMLIENTQEKDFTLNETKDEIGVTINKVITNTNLPKQKVNEEQQTNKSEIVAIKKIALKSKAQFYLATGIGYRVLYDKLNTGNTIPFASQNGNNGNGLDGSIFHKPATSVETGVVWVKPINKNIEFKVGAQANYNSYKIKTSQGNPQLATIAFTGNSAGAQLNQITTIRNAEGLYPQWKENSSLTVSMPIGLNFLTKNNTKVRFGFSTTIQPSLMIKSKMLLLSTDLKSYIEAPYLVRKVNLNTAIEPFIAFSSKKMQYQFGPQLRYQLMSTYSKKYPFKENLFDYGFKVAISKPY